MKNHTNKLIPSFFISFVFLLTLTTTVAALPQPASNQQEEINLAVAKGFEYIASQMNDDGGIRWFDETSSVAATIRVVQALAAAGYSQDYLASDSGERPIDFLTDNGLDWVNRMESETPGFSVARAGQLLTAVAAANQNPHSVGKQSSDLIYDLNLKYDPNSFIFGTAAPDNITDQVWAIIGLAANNASIPIEAVDWLASVQADDGSWNDGFGSYLDTTPLGVLALVGSNHYPPDSESVQSAIAFLAENQQPDGGWQNEWDTAANPNTTGLILQALSVVGQSPEQQDWQALDGKPQTALLSVKQESGAFGEEFANAYSTSDAIIGLAGRNITNLGFVQAASEALDFLLSVQEPTGGWGSVGQTVDVLLALRAAGWHPNSAVTGDETPVDYIAANLESYIDSGPDAVGKAMLGITAAGMDPTDFYEMDLSQILLSTFDVTTGVFGSADNTWHQAFGILGLYSSELNIPQSAVDTLLDMQQQDGGWEYSSGFGTSADTTSVAMQALFAAGLTSEDPAIASAVDFLKAGQKEDGGWGDSSTTSFALMIVNLLDESTNIWKTESGAMPLENLFTYQKANGSIVYTWEFPDDNIMSTASALMALFGGDYLIQTNENPAANFAAIVVDPGTGETQTACVSFSGESISGLDLLDGSGISYSVKEGFINSIMDTSNQEGETNYWSYWFWDGREWVFHNAGSGETVVLPGTIEAWHFTSWELFPSLPSDFTPDLDEICPGGALANFNKQPNLDWNDVYPLAFETPAEIIAGSIEVAKEPVLTSQETEMTSEETEEILDATEIATDVIGEPEEKQKAPARSPLPLFIIGAAALIMIIIFGLVFLEKRK